MSLYNNIAAELQQGIGWLDMVQGSLGGAIGQLANQAAQAVGGGALAQRIAQQGAHMATQAATSLIHQQMPAKARQILNRGGSALGHAMRGNWEQAGLQLLDSGLLQEIFPTMRGLFSQSQYWGSPTPLLGGVSPQAAKRLHQEIQSQSFARKNLFLVEVSSALRGDMSWRFNMFATELDYTPFQVVAEKRRIGAALVDSVQGDEAVELRITTMDDVQGSIKAWFAAHHGAVAAEDGTVGVPAHYAVRFRLVHAFTQSDAAQAAGGYEDIGLFRPQSMEISLSRREDAMQEIQMTFSQLDTFIRP